MPRIADGQGATNADLLKEGESQFLGTSSLPSDSGPVKSGTPQTTGRLSPAQGAENPSSTGLHLKQAPSTADLTTGSTHETGFSQLSPSGSSEDSATEKAATPDQVLAADLDAAEPEPAVEPYAGISGPEAMELARGEYTKGNYDESERLLAVAESRGADTTEIARARGYIAEARAHAGAPAPAPEPTSEETPSAGGFVAP